MNTLECFACYRRGDGPIAPVYQLDHGVFRKLTASSAGAPNNDDEAWRDVSYAM